MTNRQPWHAMTQDLVAVAMGRKHADMVICNGRWVNVHSGEILPGTDVAVIGGCLLISPQVFLPDLNFSSGSRPVERPVSVKH